MAFASDGRPNAAAVVPPKRTAAPILPPARGTSFHDEDPSSLFRPFRRNRMSGFRRFAGSSGFSPIMSTAAGDRRPHTAHLTRQRVEGVD
ncbi:MAG: hypothetical protein D6725_16070 [Planctomycetota bacterium]|nr:MAG: hypothetical protein D6725_16070 [Planctomycetota bacterium]